MGLLGDIANLAALPYNIYAQERAHRQSQQAQAWQQSYASNQYSIRRKDLESAGLHPSLAAGGMHGASPAQATTHNPTAMSVQQQGALSNIASAADISRTLAETSLIGSQEEEIKHESTRRDIQQGINMLDHRLRAKLNRAQVALTWQDQIMRVAENKYVEFAGGGFKMPTRNALAEEIAHQLRGIFGDRLSPRSIGDVTTMVVDGLIATIPLNMLTHVDRLGQSLLDRYNISRGARNRRAAQMLEDKLTDLADKLDMPRH